MQFNNDSFKEEASNYALQQSLICQGIEKTFKENELILDQWNSTVKNYLHDKDDYNKQLSQISLKEEKLIIETVNTL